MRKIVILFMTGSLIWAQSTLGYINQLRQKSGLKPLHYSKSLEKAALHHAKYLAFNNELNHYESSGAKGFFGTFPWDRVVKAGFGTRVAVENISFYEKDFKASVDKLMGTVYHRLAFLDFRIDSIGFAQYKKRYVYDMSNSKIASLCKNKKFHSAYGVDGLCSDPKKLLDQEAYNKAILSTLSKSKKVSFYPYRNQRNVPLTLIEERPVFLYGKYGFPITVRFNNYFVRRVHLISFKLYRNNQEVKSKIVTNSNDIQSKIDEFTFVLVPLHPLEPKSTYKVALKVREDGKIKNYTWRFSTK